MKKGLLSIFAVAVLMLVSVIGYAQTTYTKVNTVAELEAGEQYILVGYDADGNAFVMGYQKSNNRHAIAIDDNGGIITATVATDPSQQDVPFEFTLGGSADAWTIYDPLNGGYLYAPGGGNYLRTQSTLDDKGQWSITEGEGGGFIPVSNGGVEQNIMRYNITSTLFGCYKESSNVSALVYFFKADGTVAPSPEPTNYPTQFTATVDGVDAYCVWADATGAQLPTKYLVLASTGNITVPTDGTPVPDGELAKNVAYGTGAVIFEGLQPNTTYHFAIFPYTNSGANIDYKTDGNYPTATAHTEEVYYLLDEDFDEDLGSFVAVNVVGEQEWHQASYQGTTYANMNGYANQANHQNEDWLIGYVEIPQGVGYNEIWVSFRTAMKFDGDPLRVAVSTNYDGLGDPSAADWANITDGFDFSTGNYEWVESGSVDVHGFVGNESFYLAFIYTCTDEAASSWEIDYVKVIGQDLTAVNESEVATIGLYPNPAHETVSFSLEGDAQVSVFDVTGRMVSTMNMAAGEAQYQLSELESGVYFLNVRYADGKTAVTRFVKF